MPEGLHGQMIIFFNQSDGQPIQYEDDARVYKVPASGLLKTQFPRNGGCIGDNRIQFFYEDSIGRRQQVAFFMDIDRDSIPADRDHVLMTFLSETGTKPEFVIHLIGSVDEYQELTRSVTKINTEEILESL